MLYVYFVFEFEIRLGRGGRGGRGRFVEGVGVDVGGVEEEVVVGEEGGWVRG